MEYKEIKAVLIEKTQIEQKVAELGAQITKDFEGERPLVVCTLKGAVTFFAPKFCAGRGAVCTFCVPPN